MSDGNERETEESTRVVIRDKRRFDPQTGEPREVHDDDEPPADADLTAADDDADGEDGPEPGALFEPRRKAASPSPGGAALQRKLAERTADLQRLSAEYANYRKRAERDRATAGELATGSVLAALLPVLDNLDRAREHGDLTGAFKAVADQLSEELDKLGLESFGDTGDPFDPMVHEAVAHQTSADVSEPTCVMVMRRGYRHGERLLRAALVAVADPESSPDATEPAEGDDAPSPAGPGMSSQEVAAEGANEPSGPPVEPRGGSVDPAAPPGGPRAGDEG